MELQLCNTQRDSKQTLVYINSFQASTTYCSLLHHCLSLSKLGKFAFILSVYFFFLIKITTRAVQI